MTKHLLILGTRGVPARHGGFETFAEKLSLYLVSLGWKVTVYCQEDNAGEASESIWQGINRIHIPVSSTGAKASVIFDFKAAAHARRFGRNVLLLTLGYNTAAFHIIQRTYGQRNVINMDGIEWKRQKWGRVAKTWFWLNERAGCYLGNHLIADHPRIKNHLATRVHESKITMIPYGGDTVTDANLKHIHELELTERGFSVVIARPEPENSILEIVSAFSSVKRDHKLVVLGNFSPDANTYHKSVLDAASDEVIFPGAIYDKEKVSALRYYSKFYIHGHQVGGTNPSLVEAMAAGCAVLAHDNEYNRWVANNGALYFRDQNQCEQLFNKTLFEEFSTESLSAASIKRFNEELTWSKVLGAYEKLLEQWHPETDRLTALKPR